MRFLNELHEGDRINGIYLCKQKQSAVTKNGKPYENIILQDKTGSWMERSGIRILLELMILYALDYIDVVGGCDQLCRGYAAEYQACAQGC